MSHVSLSAASAAAAASGVTLAPPIAVNANAAAPSAAVAAAVAPALGAVGQLPQTAAELASAASLAKWTAEVAVVLEAAKVTVQSFNDDENLLKARVFKAVYNMADCGGRLDVDLEAGRFLGADKNKAVLLRQSMFNRVALLTALSYQFAWNKTVLKPLIFAFWSSYFTQHVGTKVRNLPHEFLAILPNALECPAMTLLRLSVNLDPKTKLQLKNNIIHSVLYLQYFANAILSCDLSENAYVEVQDRIKEYIRIAVHKFSSDFLFKELIPLLQDYKKVETQKGLVLDPMQKKAFYDLPRILAACPDGKVNRSKAPPPPVAAADSKEAFQRVDFKAAAAASAKADTKTASGGAAGSGNAAGSSVAVQAAVTTPKTSVQELADLERDLDGIKVPEIARYAVKENLISELYDLCRVSQCLQDFLEEEGSVALLEKAGGLLAKVKPKMLQMITVAAQYAMVHEPLFLEDVLFPLMMSFSCFPLDRALVEPASPLPKAFLEILSQPDPDLKDAKKEKERVAIYGIHDLVCLRDKIKELGLKVGLHMDAYKEINRRIAKYMDYAAFISADFLIKTVIPLVSSPKANANGLQLVPVPDPILLEWVGYLGREPQATAATAAAQAN